MDINNTTPCCDDGCCADSVDVRETVREGYGQIARSGTWSSVESKSGGSEAGASAGAGGSCGGGGGGGGCCGPTTLTADQVAQAVGYAESELSAIPESANMGLSCGNPTALASLREGEVVLDLGSGGGLDCYIAGPRVGASGRVIGVDMTPGMIDRARAGLASYRKRSGQDNVEFRLGEIEHLPIADASVDVVISNCVLNLSPDKGQVWREIARVLRPGGRVAVSDLALLRALPEGVMENVEALIGCVSGASLVEDIRKDAESAGLIEISLEAKPEYIEAMTDWADPLYKGILDLLPEGASPADYITSLNITARRP